MVTPVAASPNVAGKSPPREALICALSLAAPLAMALALTIRVPREHITAALALWALLEVVLLRDFLRGRESHSSAIDVETAQLGERAAVAEEAVRQEQERLHELRSSVAGLGATHRLLRENARSLPPPTRDRLESLCDAEIYRMERLLGSQETSAPECLDLDDVLDPIVDALRLRGEVVSRRGHGAPVLCRRDDLVEILQILTENAARHAPHRPMEIRVLESPGQVRLQVTDDGEGVCPELAPYLFERGVRSPYSPGQGLGLHIAQRLAREMDGDLRLEGPEPGHGATFTLQLPAPPGGTT